MKNEGVLSGRSSDTTQSRYWPEPATVRSKTGH
jgi:hypothetical protein